jgi:hypothetical protein
MSTSVEAVLAFVIAAVVGITGIGGGTFVTPILVLAAGLAPTQAVGTSFLFAAVLKFFAAPFYVARKQVDASYLIPLLVGSVPGMVLGTLLLRILRLEPTPVVLCILGAMLTMSSGITFAFRIWQSQLCVRRRTSISLLAFPIGVEAGFSSAGAGALGTILLLNCSDLSVATVVGTDLALGIVLAALGSAFHMAWGSIDYLTLVRLLVGGIPGVLIGCAVANRIPGRKLRLAISTIAVALGLQLLWTGTSSVRRAQTGTKSGQRKQVTNSQPLPIQRYIDSHN